MRYCIYEVSSNHTLNPLADTFSPQSFSILENQGETFPDLNSNSIRHFSVNILPESSPTGLMFVPMLCYLPVLCNYHLPANCFSPVQTGPSNMVLLNHTLNPLADLTGIR